MTQGTFYFDSDNCPRAEYPPPFEMIGWYLEQDVQSSLSTCDELLRLCDDFCKGRRDEWQGTGNIHTVSIRDSRVQIENEFTDSAASCVLSIDDFKTALLSWRELIRPGS